MSRAEHELYLIDANSYVYRAFFALPPLTSPTGMPTNAVYGYTTMILKLLRTAKPRYLAAVFDAPGRTFRDELYADYKAQRPAMPQDLATQLPFVREITAAFRLPSMSVAGVEADDVIATLAKLAVADGFDVVVVTSDKDLLQIVGPQVRIWDTMRDRWFDTKGVIQRFGVRPEQIIDLIGLMGDSVDNIPGVKGIGEKTARTLLENFGSLDTVLAHLDEVGALVQLRGAKKTAATLREQSDLARMSRDLARVRADLELDITPTSLQYENPGAEALRPIFSRFGFQRLLKELPSAAPPLRVDLQEVSDTPALRALLTEMNPARVVAFATAIGTDDPPGTLLACGAGTFHVPSSVDSPAGVFATLVASGARLVAHDLKHEMRAMGVVDVDTGGWFDVMLASYVSEASVTHRLEDLAQDMLGMNVPSFRGAKDSLAAGVSVLPRLCERLETKLAEYKAGPLFYEVEMPLIGVLSRMEARGVRLDVKALAELRIEMEGRLARLEAEIFESAGGPFNIGSPQQLREVLFDRLGLSSRGVKRVKTGLSTDVDVLTRLAADHPLPAKILDFRSLAKLKSTYVDALPAALDPRTGRLHTRFNQAIAVTGRLSSSDPNLQNIPVRGDEGQRIRAAFVAAEGSLLVVADYSQIELRVLAHLSEDPVLLAAFRAGEDIHTRTAAEVFGVLPGLVSREMRRTAKVINFGILYGMGAQALARELSVSIRDAERYIGSYFERYAGVNAYLEATRAAAREEGFVSTILGRRRSLPELASRDRNLAQAAERTATNTPIQGSAADLIKLAMVRIDKRLRSLAGQAAMILQVHDELVVEVEEAHSAAVQAVIREEMEGVMVLKVPLVVALGAGRNWADAHR